MRVIRGRDWYHMGNETPHNLRSCREVSCPNSHIEAVAEKQSHNKTLCQDQQIPQHLSHRRSIPKEISQEQTQARTTSREIVLIILPLYGIINVAGSTDD